MVRLQLLLLRSCWQKSWKVDFQRVFVVSSSRHLSKTFLSFLKSLQTCDRIWFVALNWKWIGNVLKMNWKRIDFLKMNWKWSKIICHKYGNKTTKDELKGPILKDAEYEKSVLKGRAFKFRFHLFFSPKGKLAAVQAWKRRKSPSLISLYRNRGVRKSYSTTFINQAFDIVVWMLFRSRCNSKPLCQSFNEWRLLLIGKARSQITCRHFPNQKN